MPLFIAPKDQELKILKVLADEKTKRHLMNLGICVGTKVSIVSHTSQDVILKVLDASLALNKDTALKIIVA